MHETIAHALKTGSKSKIKPLKEFHAKEVHSGGYHVTRHSGHPSQPAQEVHTNDFGDVSAMLEDHMGAPNDGEGEEYGGAQ